MGRYYVGYFQDSVRIEELGTSWREKVGMNVDVNLLQHIGPHKAERRDLPPQHLSINPFEVRLGPDLREFSIGILTSASAPSSRLTLSSGYL